MRQLRLIISIWILGLFISSCQSNETVGSINTEIDVFDNDQNDLSIKIRGRYSIIQTALSKKDINYVANEPDKIEFINKTLNVLTAEYGAGEIYNYERKVIEERLKDYLEKNYHNQELKILDLYFASVNISDSLMDILIERDIQRELKKKQ